MSGSSSPSALALVDQLDGAVAALLPAFNFETSNNVSWSPELQQQATQNAVALRQAADNLKQWLLEVKKQKQKSAAPISVQQEIAQLEEELKEKDALLKETKEKLAKWQKRCQDLQDAHERNERKLFDVTRDAPRS